MTTAARFETAGAIVATTAAAIGAVWLTGDPRAFGVVIAAAGFAVALYLGRQEWGTPQPRRVDNGGRHETNGADFNKAA